jgi:hypothetical protein
MSKEMRNMINSFKKNFLKENSSPEYDSMLDIYNRRKDKMTQTEKYFFNSGGQDGANFYYRLNDDIKEAIDNTIDYLDDNNIEWSIKETWAPALGMLRYIETKKDTNIFKNIQSFFSGIKNDSIIPFVKVYDEENEINVWLINPDDYKDIVLEPFSGFDD